MEKENDYEVNIAGLDKAEVLCTLVNNAKVPQNRSFAEAIGTALWLARKDDFTIEDARRALEFRKNIQYIGGKPIKIDFEDNVINIYAYDRDNGISARAIIQRLMNKKKMQEEKEAVAVINEKSPSRLSM